VVFSHGPNKTFLVSDSCRATVRNGTNISADLTEDTIEKFIITTLVSTIFRQFGTIYRLDDIAG